MSSPDAMISYAKTQKKDANYNLMCSFWKTVGIVLYREAREQAILTIHPHREHATSGGWGDN